MFEYFKKIKNSELAMGSLILIFLFNIGNLFSYFFQFFMARMLGPADYGVFAFLLSIVYIFTIPTSSIQTIISKYTTKLNTKKEFGKLKGLLYFSIKKLLKISIITFFIYFIVLSVGFFVFYSLKGRFPEVSFWLFVITGLVIFNSFISPVGLGILQGMKKFFALGLNAVISNGLKFTLALLLVYFNFRVFGALLGIIFGSFIAFVFILPFIKEITNTKTKETKIHLFSEEAGPTFFSMLFIVLIYSIDVIFAKFFFSPETAGQYAGLSMIGKIILFGAISIANAMFPISSEKFLKKNSETQKLIRKTFGTLLLLCLFAIILFLLFPKMVISLLFGEAYLPLSNLLGYVAISFSFISFTNLMVLYRISTDRFKIKHAVYLFFLFLTQMLLMFFFRTSIEKFVLAFMFASIIIFLVSWITGRNENE
jgi:O-antigen/teichoic acid export membrane protein